MASICCCAASHRSLNAQISASQRDGVHPSAERPPLRRSPPGPPTLARPIVLEGRSPMQPLRAAAPWHTDDEEAAIPLFTPEEAASGLSADQLAFLDRKRRGIMPQGSLCPACSGTGMCVCHKCNGSGVNAYQVDEEMFAGEVKQTNGLVDTRTFFWKDFPCWLCRGKTEIACPDCEGVGFRGVSQLYTGD
eukprot:scaffold4.g4622.t1